MAASAYSIPPPAQKVVDPAPAYAAPYELYAAPAKSADVYAAPAYAAPAYEAPVVVAPVKAVCTLNFFPLLRSSYLHEIRTVLLVRRGYLINKKTHR